MVGIVGISGLADGVGVFGTDSTAFNAALTNAGLAETLPITGAIATGGILGTAAGTYTASQLDADSHANDPGYQSSHAGAAVLGGGIGAVATGAVAVVTTLALVSNPAGWAVLAAGAAGAAVGGYVGSIVGWFTAGTPANQIHQAENG